MADAWRGGHVFVVPADLTQLACDDVLVPTDRQLTVTESWLPMLPEKLVRGSDRKGTDAAGRDAAPLRLDPPNSWQRGGRVFPLPDADTGSRGGRRQVWLVDTGEEDRDVEWLLAGVREFLDAVADTPIDRPLNGRARRLVALPPVGTGGGSAAGQRGELIRQLLPVLRDCAEQHGFDIALVTQSGSDHDAAQHVRLALGWSWPTAPELCTIANRLARHARAGMLALFLGAGVSAAAGLPLWSELLADLADRAGFGDGERAELLSLDPQDAASLLAHRLGGEALRAYVVERFAVRPFALAHALLAGLPVRELATTNYDPLFELAAQGIGKRLRVLPFEPAEEPAESGAGAGSGADGAAPAWPTSDAWLVKLHGDVARPETVVLTREQYLAAARERAALDGVVQALLLTRHVLFVGFSLLDDHFVRIAHDVRAVLRSTRADRLGTALTLTEQPVRAELWNADIEFVAMCPADTPAPEAARQLEVFLDQLGALAAPPAGFLLDPAYSGMLGETEGELSRRLSAVADGETDLLDSCAAWGEVAELLRAFGWRRPDASSR